MKRVISFVLSVVFTLCLLTACGSGNKKNSVVNHPSNSGSSANSNEPYVWRIARRGIYENGEWAMAGLGYKRNEYGLYTAINVLDESGNVIGDNAQITETCDENGRLTSFDNGYTTYCFAYDTSGKMSEISVLNKKKEKLVLLNYTNDGGFSFTRYDDNYPDTYTIDIYDENLRQLDHKYVKQGKEATAQEYRGGLLVSEDYGDNFFDYHIEYSYDSEDRLIKSVKTKTMRQTGQLAREYIDEYTYSAKGFLLTHYGTEYHDPLAPDGRLYAFEEYTEADYDAWGNCLYYYEGDRSGQFQKKAYEANKYEYAEEGWLLRKNETNGDFTVYNKEGEMVVNKRGNLCYGYEPYPIMDDALLRTFYTLCADDYV